MQPFSWNFNPPLSRDKANQNRHSKKVGRNTCITLAQALTKTYIKNVSTQLAWQRGAACKGVPSYIFFPEEKAFEGFKENPLFLGKKASDYCDTCPVRAICLEFSVLHDAEGIWSSTSTNERSRRYPKEERFEMRNDLEEMGSYEPLYGHS